MRNDFGKVLDDKLIKNSPIRYILFLCVSSGWLLQTSIMCVERAVQQNARKNKQQSHERNGLYNK